MIASREGQTKIPIVLTATVVPNGIAGAISDPQLRLEEYVRVLKFYRQFAPIIFLENSNYPLEQHPAFRETAGLQIKRFPPSANSKFGKGYQEFEMLDAWLTQTPEPPARWIKISGRYQVRNIDTILNECNLTGDSQFVIDQLKYKQFARTYLFCVDTDFYLQHLRGIYRDCDDPAGRWIERVIFQKMKTISARQTRFFKTQPNLIAVDATSGRPFPSGRGQWFRKLILRRLNRLADRQYLWH